MKDNEEKKYFVMYLKYLDFEGPKREFWEIIGGPYSTEDEAKEKYNEAKPHAICKICETITFKNC